MLVVYNLDNGVRKVFANGYEATVSNGDAGQQWVLNRNSFTNTDQPFVEALTIEVIGLNGGGQDMEYYILLNTEDFDAECAQPNTFAHRADVLGENFPLMTYV